MFALVDTKGATHIAINIPLQGAEKTIPALVGMLEQNAKFICKSWSEIEERKPEMSIQLGNQIVFENRESEVVILSPDSTSVLSESFVPMEPAVLVSNKKAMEAREVEISRLRTELAHVKQQLADLQELTSQED